MDGHNSLSYRAPSLTRFTSARLGDNPSLARREAGKRKLLRLCAGILAFKAAGCLRPYSEKRVEERALRIEPNVQIVSVPAVSLQEERIGRASDSPASA